MDIQHARGSEWIPSNWVKGQPSECMNRCYSKMNETFICQEVNYCLNAMECNSRFFAFEKAVIKDCNCHPHMDMTKEPCNTCMKIFATKMPNCEKAIRNCLKQCGKEEKCLTLKSER